MPKSVFSSKVDIKDEKKLKQTLEKDGFVLEPVDHAFWQAKKDRVFITFYRSGKVVIRGKNIDGYADKYLGELKTNQEIHGLEKVHNLREWIGTDESGKGDFFEGIFCNRHRDLNDGFCFSPGQNHDLPGSG